MSPVWSRVLAATWVLVAVAHGFVSVASRRTGKPLWWVDNAGFVDSATPAIGAAIVFALMLFGFVIALRRSRNAAPWSALVAILLVASALADLSTASGAAYAAGAASVAGLFASIAALAGRTQQN